MENLLARCNITIIKLLCARKFAIAKIQCASNGQVNTFGDTIYFTVDGTLNSQKRIEFYLKAKERRKNWILPQSDARIMKTELSE